MPKRRRVATPPAGPALFDWTGPDVPAPAPAGPVRVLRMRRVVDPDATVVRFVAVAAAVIITVLVNMFSAQADLPIGVLVAMYAGLVVLLTAGLRRMLAPTEAP